MILWKRRFLPKPRIRSFGSLNRLRGICPVNLLLSIKRNKGWISLSTFTFNQKYQKRILTKGKNFQTTFTSFCIFLSIHPWHEGGKRVGKGYTAIVVYWQSAGHIIVSWYDQNMITLLETMSNISINKDQWNHNVDSRTKIKYHQFIVI